MNQSLITHMPNTIGGCPFCASAAHIILEGLDPLRYAVKCRNCGASIPAIHLSSRDAINTWNHRAGLATLGGRATAGKCSRRKRASCRRNLKQAQKAKMLKAMRAKVEAIIPILRAARAEELALIEQKTGWGLLPSEVPA